MYTRQLGDIDWGAAATAVLNTYTQAQGIKAAARAATVPMYPPQVVSPPPGSIALPQQGIINSVGLLAAAGVVAFMLFGGRRRR